MTQRIAVFLGPTLARSRAEAMLDAVYLPPAEQGSVLRAVQALDPHLIVLIDGVFAQAPAVRHKEILWALSQGIPIIGAASMGALRAAELSEFGMVGHGLIYRWYRATPFADDDEVAVGMAPAELGAYAISDALINIRVSLRRAERAGLASRQLRLALEDAARSMHFLERTYDAVFATARVRFPVESASQIKLLESWLAEHAVDQKQADATSLLGVLAASPERLMVRPSPAPFRLTEAWADDVAAAGDALDVKHVSDPSTSM